MDLKVIEKSRKLLIQCMGQDKYDQFIEDGKILINHKDPKDDTKEILYELDQDARIYNKTTNESYCIEPLAPDNLPIHDQIALKYSYLKNNIKRVEEVANKRSLNTQYNYNSSIVQGIGREIRSSRPDYSSYVEYMESQGWMREQITLDERNSQIVAINDVKNDHPSSPAIIVQSPVGYIISFMGIHQIPAGMDIRYAHAIRIKFANDADREIPDNSGIRITKEKSYESVIQLERLHYSDLNLTKKPTTDNNNSININNNNNSNINNINNNNNYVFKRDDEWYRFSRGVELNSEDMLKIYVTDPETDICSRNTKLAIDCDLWHR